MKRLLRIYRVKNSGFTLIETMVVATIFSFVAAAIAMSFISGIKLWNRARNSDFAKYQFLLDLENVSKELRQAINEPAIKFEGTVGEVAFPLLARGKVAKVVYKFEPSAKTLIRKEMDMEDVLEKKEEGGWTEKRLLGWEDFSLSYFNGKAAEAPGYEWIDEWEKDKGIFTAIKIKAKFNNEEFTKVVFISAS